MKFSKLSAAQRKKVHRLFGMRYVTSATEVLVNGSVLIFNVDIDPSLGTELLKRLHPNQRKLSAGGTDSIAVDMVKKRYAYLCDPIRFDAKGRLVDGQHRLRALIKAGVTITFLVAMNFQEDAIRKIDSNRARSNPDHATIAGRPLEQRTGRYQTLLNGLYTIERYTNHALPAKASFDTLNIDVEDTYERALVELQELRLEYHHKFTAPVWSMMHYLYVISPRKAKRFIKMVAQEAGYQAGTAPHAFVTFLRGFKQSCKGSTVGGVPNRTRLHLATLRSMRAYFANESIKRVDGNLLIDEEGYPIQARDDEAILWAGKELKKRKVRQVSVLAA